MTANNALAGAGAAEESAGWNSVLALGKGAHNPMKWHAVQHTHSGYASLPSVLAIRGRGDFTRTVATIVPATRTVVRVARSGPRNGPTALARFGHRGDRCGDSVAIPAAAIPTSAAVGRRPTASTLVHDPLTIATARAHLAAHR